MTDDLHDSGTGLAGKFGSDRLAISQAAFLDSHLDELVCVEGFICGFDNFIVEVLFADHDKGAQAVALTAQKPVLLAG